MTTRFLLIGLATASLLAAPIALAEPKSEKTDPSTVDSFEGQVTKVDPVQRRVSVKDQGGTTREFEASNETINDIKVGDRIEAKKRAEKPTR